MKFKSHIVTQASGSVGGTTYATNQGGLYMRARSIPTNPNTSFQAAYRNFFRTVMNAWTNTLTAAQRAAWSTYAKNTPVINSLGSSIILGDNAMFLRTNGIALQNGIALFTAAPTTFDLGSFTAPVPSITHASTSMSVAFTAGDTWNTAGGALLIYASRQQNASINFFKGPFRLVGKISGTATSPQSFVLPFAAGPTTSAMFIKVSALQPDGRLSNPLIIKSTPV